jgi:lipopolysaccharide/colanic/teichoic acid biosynthesis glycosyltransferase
MYKFFKRFLSVFIASVAILVFSPVFIIIPILIAIFLGSPVLFKQKRVGLNNKIFTLYKFRSMNNKKDENGNLLPDEVRLTTFGKILRKTSLDELPQLFNILKGDMAIIGPRPKTVEEITLVKDTKYVYRQCVRPGITGLAVIKGRNLLNPDKAYRLDLEYVANINLWLDIKIFVYTFIVVLMKKGVTSNNAVTFIPHYIFWEQFGLKTHDEISRLKIEAKSLVDTNAKSLPGDIDFEKERRKLVSKYKLTKNKTKLRAKANE